MLNSYRIFPTTGESLNPCPRERRAGGQASSGTAPGVPGCLLPCSQIGLTLFLVCIPKLEVASHQK